MKRKLYLLFFIIYCFTYSSCIREEVQKQNNKVFFNASRADVYVQNIAYLLEEVNNSDPFVAPFITEYGSPLWEEADLVYEDGTTICLIPLLHRSDNKIINSVWLFHIKENELSYAPIKRKEIKELEPSQEAIFDVYSYNKFGESNTSGYSFSSPESVTRVWADEYTCRDAYTVIGGIWKYHGTVCTSTKVWIEAMRDFFNENIGGGGGTPGTGTVAGNPGTGGNGGGGNPTNPLGFSTAVSQLIDKNNNLNVTQLNKLIKAVDEMLEDCSYAAIYNYLVSNGVKFNSVKINPNLAGESGIDPSSGDLLFRNTDAIDAGAVYHEMFHLFQISQGSHTSDEVIGLMEYERTLLEDIAFTVNKADKKGNIRPDRYSERKSPWVDNGSPTESDLYREWLKKLTKGRKVLPESISEKDFVEWKNLFARAPAYRNHNYSLSYNNKAMNKALELIKINCNK